MAKGRYINVLNNNNNNRSKAKFMPSFRDSIFQLLPVPACMAGVKAGRVHLCRVADITVSSHMAGDAP